MFAFFKTFFIVLFLIVLVIVIRIINGIRRAIKGYFEEVSYRKEERARYKRLERELMREERIHEKIEKRREKKAQKRYKKVQNRKNTAGYFANGITEKEFKAIVAQNGKHIKRITNISTSGPEVYVTVRSQSGISEWEFSIDFSNYGYVTGDYKITCRENFDSNIPENLAKHISADIKQVLAG